MDAIEDTAGFIVEQAGALSRARFESLYSVATLKKALAAASD